MRCLFWLYLAHVGAVLAATTPGTWTYYSTIYITSTIRTSTSTIRTYVDLTATVSVNTPTSTNIVTQYAATTSSSPASTVTEYYVVAESYVDPPPLPSGVPVVTIPVSPEIPSRGHHQPILEPEM